MLNNNNNTSDKKIHLPENIVNKLKDVINKKYANLNEIALLVLYFDESKEKLKEELKNLSLEEQKINKTIKETYGNGELNILDWTYVLKS